MSKIFPNRFVKQPRDLYPTPLVTVLPLIPHLRAARVKTFCEPCEGEGDLVRHLAGNGLECVLHSDIATGTCALSIESFPAAVITNPPFSRENTRLMLAMIARFIERAPFAWLLLPVDKATNKNMQPFMRHCSHIVIAGRDKWLDDGGSGTSTLAWYRFERTHIAGPVFHNGPALLERLVARSCAHCGGTYQPSRSDARYCAARCRKRAQRSRDTAVTNDLMPVNCLAGEVRP